MPSTHGWCSTWRKSECNLADWALSSGLAMQPVFLPLGCSESPTSSANLFGLSTWSTLVPCLHLLFFMYLVPQGMTRPLFWLLRLEPRKSASTSVLISPTTDALQTLPETSVLCTFLSISALLSLFLLPIFLVWLRQLPPDTSSGVPSDSRGFSYCGCSDLSKAAAEPRHWERAWCWERLRGGR